MFYLLNNEDNRLSSQDTPKFTKISLSEVFEKYLYSKSMLQKVN